MSKSQNIKPENRIYVFDFDGTITTKDTFALFLKYYAGSANWLGNVLRLLPKFIAYKTGLIDRHAVKKAVVNRFFANQSFSDIEIRAEQFAKDIIPTLIRPAALKNVRSKLENPEIGPSSLYICSASIGPYLRHWARSVGIHEKNVMATELEFINDRATGKLEGYNVWGPNKVRRINDQFAPSPVNIVEAYGDTRGDREMLHAAEASFHKPFRL